MPHPAPPTPVATASTTSNNPLISQAHASANSIFKNHVQAVLKRSASAGLRRLLNARIHAHLLHKEMTSPNGGGSEHPEKDTILSFFRENPNLLQVTQEDLDKCYSFASRVGTRWADVLKRNGCIEFSGLVLDLVQSGHYLEPNSLQNNNNDETDNDVTSMVDVFSKFSTPYAALNSLRRYEPDCDGSGNASKHLSSVGQEINDSSARKIIQLIDKMAYNGQTEWYHGWDAIEEAVRRNRQRIAYSRANHEEDESKEGGKVKEAKKRVQFEDTIEEQTDDEVVLGLKNDHGLDATESVALGKTYETKMDRFRPPSSIGDTVYSWESILQSMSSQERSDLIVSSIHPPYPFENTEGLNESRYKSTVKEEHSANIVGALKEIGMTHLFEQTRHLPSKEKKNDEDEINFSISNGLETFLCASETRASFKSQQFNRIKKRAKRMAERERLGRRTPVVDDKNDEYHDSGAAGKVIWTEEEDQRSCRSNTKEVEFPNKNSGVPSLQIYDEPERHRWLELDLGECFLEEELKDDFEISQGSSSFRQTKKRYLAFRSLELAIKD